MTKPKLKTTRDVLHLKSFTYWIRQALASLEGLTPEARAAVGRMIGDLNLSQFKDLETLEKELRRISHFG